MVFHQNALPGCVRIHSDSSQQLESTQAVRRYPTMKALCKMFGRRLGCKTTFWFVCKNLKQPIWAGREQGLVRGGMWGCPCRQIVGAQQAPQDRQAEAQNIHKPLRHLFNVQMWSDNAVGQGPAGERSLDSNPSSQRFTFMTAHAVKVTMLIPPSSLS